MNIEQGISNSEVIMNSIEEKKYFVNNFEVNRLYSKLGHSIFRIQYSIF